MIAVLTLKLESMEIFSMNVRISDPEELGISASRLTRLNSTIERYVTDDRLAGSVALLARRNRLVHLKSYVWQDRESQTPMADNTIFRIYSMIKPITCVAFMTLLEEGLVILIDPVEK